MSADRPLDVAVNLLWCVPGEVGGSEEYLTRQLLGLAEVDPGHQRVRPTLFASHVYAVAHPDLAARHVVRSPRLDLHRRRPARVVTEHTWLAAATRGRRFDLVHHGGGTVPATGGRPVLLTVHDLQYLEFPGYFSPTKRRYLGAVMPRSVARATVVATPTEFVRTTVLESFDVDPERVVVVPHGMPHRVDSGPRHVDEIDGVDGVRARFGLGDGPVLVYPAITHPHKNHVVLLEAMARHWDEPDLRLVLLGGPGAAEADVVRRIDELSLGDRVIRPGRVPDADRDSLVGIADALLFPSRYEGFGAPVIEAMALGTPVVCADVPALREVVGPAGVLVDDDPDAWGAALDEARRRRDELVAAGRSRLARFTAAVSATALLDAYGRTVAEGGRR